MDFEQLRLFKDVGELKSFSHAGWRFHLSRSAVSLKIKRLEEDLGCLLLERRGRAGLRLTAGGRLFLTYCHRVLDLTDGMMASLETLQYGRLGSVTIGATLTAYIYLLPPLIREFSCQNASIGVDVVGGFVPELLESVERGNIDLGLVWGPVDTRLFRCEQIRDDDVVAVTTPVHPLARRSRVDAFDLDQFPVVLSAPRSMSRRFIIDRLEKAGARLRQTVEFGTPAAIKEAVLAGLGIGFLSPLAVHRELVNGDMVRLPLAGVDLTRQLVLVSSRSHSLSPAAERFHDYLCRVSPLSAGLAPAAMRASWV